MALLKVITLGDPVLRAKAAPVTRFDSQLAQLAQNMLETMDEAPGVGLAAPQVGVSIRMFVYDAGEEGQRGAICNPEIVWTSDELVEMEEGCLSIPDVYLPVTRPESVTVEGFTVEKVPIRIEATDILARIFQHEIDHLDGILFIDHLPKELRKQAMASMREQDMGMRPPPGRTL